MSKHTKSADLFSTDDGLDLRSIRWEGYSHQQMYDMVMSGEPSKVSQQAEQHWLDVAKALQEHVDDVHNTVQQLLSTWSGPSAQQAAGSVNALTDWAGKVASASHAAYVQQSHHAWGLDDARKDMPAPVFYHAEQDLGHSTVHVNTADPAGRAELAELAADLHQKRQAAVAAKNKAVTVMTTYAHQSEGVKHSLPTYPDPPARIGTHAPVAQPMMPTNVGAAPPATGQPPANSTPPADSGTSAASVSMPPNPGDGGSYGDGGAGMPYGGSPYGGSPYGGDQYGGGDSGVGTGAAGGFGVGAPGFGSGGSGFTDGSGGSGFADGAGGSGFAGGSGGSSGLTGGGYSGVAGGGGVGGGGTGGSASGTSAGDVTGAEQPGAASAAAMSAEEAAMGRGAAGAGMGMMPPMAGAPGGQDDEHTNKYDKGNDFYDDLPPAFPPVLGA
ncbi:MAG: hypothetical protein J2O49_00805 [Sciscionella sp.]|nr:hypothetical protein [Sciscionella sp.]